MKTPNQNNPRRGSVCLPGLGPTKLHFIAALLLLGGIGVAPAANVTMSTDDAIHTSSFDSVGHWDNGEAPSAGNDYFTTNYTLRTPEPTSSGSNYIFGGDSLSVDTSGRLLGKIGAGVGGNTTVATITVNNLILNGGMFDQAAGGGDNATLIVAGNVNVNADSIIGALGGGNAVSSFETLEFIAPISGSAALQVPNPSGSDSGVVKLSVANPYSGTVTVTTAGGGNIASTVNRILQFNDLDALSNATLNLASSQASPVSFASGINTGPFNVGALAGSASQTLTDTAGSPVTLSVGGNDASTTFSGTLTDGGNLVKVGSGTLTLTGTNSYYGDTTITGGSLQLGDGGEGGSIASSYTLTLDGNLTINRNNTVQQGMDFTSAAITGTGSLTQAGTGTTILNVANSYSGGSTVSAGELIMTSDQAGTGPITVADDAKLGVTVSDSSQLSPGTLTLGTSGTTTLEFGGVNSTTIAPINAGTVAAGGTVTVNVTSGTFASGNSYPLIHWTTSGPTDASSFALGITPGLTANLSVSGSTLYLNVSSVSDVWAGGVDSSWDLSTANWTGHASIFSNGDSVLFNDSTYNLYVNVNAAVQPGSILFNNSDAYPYSIYSSGGNNIGGSAGLTKINTGSVTLSGGVNTYTGPTVINGGTLSVGVLANGGSASDIGAASSASTNLMLDGSTLQYTGSTATTDRGATIGSGGATVEVQSGGVVLSDSGEILGSGSLTKTGAGSLALSGANTFAGGVALNEGELDINNGGSSSANSAIGTGQLTIAASTVIDNTGVSDVTLQANNPQVWNGSFTYGGFGGSLNLGTGAVSMPNSCTITVNGNTLTVGGEISGAGGLTKAGSGTLVLSGSNSFSGDVSLAEGTLAIGNDSAVGTGQLKFNGGSVGATIESMDGTAHTISNQIGFGGSAGATTIFAGTGNLKFTDDYMGNGSDKTLVVNNPRTEFTGSLGGSSARTVGGTGTLVLSGANGYSAGTIINSGATLQLGNGGTSGSLNPSGNIDNEGTLRFDRSDAIVQGIDFASAPIFGAGAVIQDGSGTVTLNAANTYSGLTKVNNGGLFIASAYQAGGNVSVADGASFGVLATSVSNSATIGNLTLGGGGATTLNFSYSTTGNPTNAALAAGAVTVNGTCAIHIGGTFDVGTFPVLKYSSLSGTFEATVDGPRGVTATLSNDTANHVLNVTVSSVGNGLVWTGTNSVSPNLWDLNTTTNWLIGGIPTYYYEDVPPGDAVTFNDQGSGVVLLSNTVSPANVTINNDSVAYTFDGTGQINSLGGLTKVGAAAVTLNVPGIFSGNTVLSNSVVSIGADQTLGNLSGNGTVNVSTGHPTLTLDNNHSSTFSGSLSGSFNLTKAGVDNLTMTDSNNVSGTLFVKAGTVTLDSGIFDLNGYCSLGHVGNDNGTLTLKGTASFSNNSDFNIGDVDQSVGTLNLQDDASFSVSSLYVGSAYTASSTCAGTVNQTSGTVTVATANFTIGGRNQGSSAGGVGYYNLSGGSVNAAGIRLGGGGVGTLTQTGGAIDCDGDVNIARYTGGTGTYNFDGGTLSANHVTSSSQANATFNFNGGVLMPRYDSAAFMQHLTQANVRDGGAVVDTTNFNIIIPQPLLHSYISGDSSVDGGLTKLGSGTLTLTGIGSTYTGPTVVEGGTLMLGAGSLYNLNDVTVSNATLGLTMNYGSGFSATTLNLKGDSALSVNYDLLSGTPGAALALSGGLTASGSTVFNLSGYGFTAGQQFPLVTYTGTPLANLNNYSLGALPVGVTASLSNNTANMSIDVVITSASETNWIPLAASDGFGSSSFNSALNWLDGNAPSAGNGYFTRAFTLRSPADSSAYTFEGDVLAVDAGGQFLFKGTDGQVITVSNLVLNGGLAVFGVSTSDNYTETLAGAVTLQTGTTSTMAANGSSGAAETLNVTAPVSGGGDLQINGIGGDLGTILLAATNTYSGATTVDGGTLVVNGAIDNSAITVNSSGTLGGTGSIAAPISVQSGGTLAAGIPSRGALTAAIGTLTAGGATVDGTVLMKIDRDGAQTSDLLSAPSIGVNPGATLTVDNIGSTNLAAGDTFTLFSTPISGSFDTVNLPVLPDSSVMWTNQLAVDGTIAVVPSNIINTNSPFLTNTFSAGSLELSWPADHTGWTLQMQVSTLGGGLGTNWVDVPGSATTNAVSIPIDTTNGAVFYRLKL